MSTRHNSTLAMVHGRLLLKGLFRTPAYWLPVILFPALLYSFFGASNAADPKTGNILLGSWSVFAVLGIALFQFGISVAQGRQSPWEGYTRTLPAGPLPRFGGQILASFVFSLIALALLWLVALMLSPLEMTAGRWLALVVMALAGAIPFALLGIALGYLASPRAAVPLANLLYLALAFLGGLWIPPQFMSPFLAKLSLFMPTRHYAELAWWAVLNVPFPWSSLGALVGFSLLFAWAGRIGWRRDTLQRYG